MLIQLFAFAFCITAVGVALMVQQLPDHRKLAAGIESTETAAVGVAQSAHGEQEASPRTYPCDGLKRRARRACRRSMANPDFDDDQPHEEPPLD